MNVKNLLGSNAFWTLNKTLVKKIGNINAAFFLTYLIDKEDYHRTKNELRTYEDWDGEFFFCAAAKAQEKTTLTTKQQTAATKILEEKGLITTILKGVPATKNFCLKHGEILDFILGENKVSQIDQTSFPKSTKLVLPNRSNYTKNILLKTEKQEHKTKETVSPLLFKTEVKTKLSKVQQQREDNITELLTFLGENYKKRKVNVELFANRNLVQKCLANFTVDEIKRGIMFTINAKLGKTFNGKKMESFIKVSTIFAIDNMSKYVANSEGENIITDAILERFIIFGVKLKNFHGEPKGEFRETIKNGIANILNDGETVDSLCELMRLAPNVSPVWNEWQFFVEQIKTLRTYVDKMKLKAS